MTQTYITRARTALVITARSYFAYLVKPRLDCNPRTEIPLSAPVIGLCLFVLSVTVTVIFGILVFPLLMMTGAAPSGPLQQVVSQSIPSVVLAVIVLGPLTEEIMFRGWLSGTWRAFLGSVLFVMIVLGGTPPIVRLAGGSGAIVPLGLAVLGLALLLLLSPIDEGKRLPYFERLFPYLFWAQGLVFGVLHLHNVVTNSSVIAILSTLPLVMCAWLWGYARLSIGITGAVLLHAAYNVPAVLGTRALMILQQA